MSVDWKKWVKAAVIRAIRTMAQTAVSLIGVGAVISEVDWLTVGSASLLAGILSLLTAVATGLPEVELEKTIKDNEEQYANMVLYFNEMMEEKHDSEEGLENGI